MEGYQKTLGFYTIEKMTDDSTTQPVAPEVVAPEVVAPEVVAPEVVAPEVVAPEVVAPVDMPASMAVTEEKTVGTANDVLAKVSEPEPETVIAGLTLNQLFIGALLLVGLYLLATNMKSTASPLAAAAATAASMKYDFSSSDSLNLASELRNINFLNKLH